MRRRNGNYSDFNSLGYLAGLIAAIAIYVVVIFLVLGSNRDSQKSYESKLAYNARAEAFNAQPITFRYAVSEFFPDINTEDYLLSVLEIDEEPPRERLPLYLTGWSIIMMMAVSLCFLVNYWQDCRAVRMGGKYFLADLPWYKPKYGFILIPMFGIPLITITAPYFIKNKFAKTKCYSYFIIHNRNCARLFSKKMSRLAIIARSCYNKHYERTRNKGSCRKFRKQLAQKGLQASRQLYRA